jgi:hypothetical protein
MKLQIEVVKAILSEIEKTNVWPETFFIDELENMDIDKNVITYHLFLMQEAGLIVGKCNVNRKEKIMLIDRLTWEGHAFLANAKNKTTWEKFKTESQSVGCFSLDVAKSALASIAASAMSDVI